MISILLEQWQLICQKAETKYGKNKKGALAKQKWHKTEMLGYTISSSYNPICHPLNCHPRVKRASKILLILCRLPNKVITFLISMEFEGFVTR